MAPIDPVVHQSNLLPISLGAGAVTVAFACLFTIVRSFRKLRRALPIAARTRQHENTRKKQIILFGVLAAVSIVVNIYNTAETLVDSYRSFFAVNSIIPDTNIWTSPLWLPRYEDVKSLQLRAWLNSDELTLRAESMLASPRDSWWFQQLQSAVVIWCLFLAVQGRRHNIPRTWAYLGLTTSFGLAPSVNLLFIALLFTPVPYEPARKPGRARSAARETQLEQLVRRLRLTRATNRPATWAPKPFVFIIPVAIAFLSQILTPYIGNLSIRDWILCFPSVIAVVLFLIEYTSLLPTSLGKTHRTIHATHSSYRTIFRTASLLSLLLHILSSYNAITANAPPVSRSRFRLFTTYEDYTAPSLFQSYAQSLAKILSAFSDSSLVQLIGWDVLLTGLSIILWAGVRGLHPGSMISSAGGAGAEELPHPKEIAEEAAAKSSAAVKSATGVETRASPKTKSALTNGTSSRRGRPSKAALQAAEADAARDPEGEDVDPTFHPSAAVEETVEHDEHAEVVDAREQAESAAVAWGVLVLGGLGVGLGAVCGAEVT